MTVAFGFMTHEISLSFPAPGLWKSLNHPSKPEKNLKNIVEFLLRVNELSGILAARSANLMIMMILIIFIWGWGGALNIYCEELALAFFEIHKIFLFRAFQKNRFLKSAAITLLIVFMRVSFLTFCSNPCWMLTLELSFLSLWVTWATHFSCSCFWKSSRHVGFLFVKYLYLWPAVFARSLSLRTVRYIQYFKSLKQKF